MLIILGVSNFKIFTVISHCILGWMAVIIHPFELYFSHNRMMGE